MATFPTYLQPLQTAFSETPRPGVQRTAMETGPPKQYLTDSQVLRRRTITYLATSASDLQSWRTWWKANRAEWFTWTDPVGGATKSARLIDGAVQETPRNPQLTQWDIALEIETLE